MTEIGRSLVFYLKYAAEMDALSENKGTLPGLESRPDAEQIRQNAETVSLRAGQEAAELLKECMRPLQTELQKSPLVWTRSCREKTMRESWQLVIDLIPRNEKKTASSRRQLGVYLYDDAIRVWLWSRGGRAAEDRIRSLLHPFPCEGSKKLGWSGGAVSFEPVPIPWQGAAEFRVAAEPIIAATHSQLKAITPKFLIGFMAADLENS